MRRITSLRPSEAFESSFDAYPAAELLIDLLRSNVTGALSVQVLASAATIYFREGVPVAARSALAGVEPRGLLRRLVAEAEGPFRFQEGQGAPPDATRAVLRPLQVLFEGLALPSARARREAFLERAITQRVRLADTYPVGSDPFGWGPEGERLLLGLSEPRRLAELVADEPARERLGAMLYALWLADMITLEGDGSAPRPRPTGGLEVPERPLDEREPGPSAQWGPMLDEVSGAGAPAAMPSIDLTVPGHAELIEALRAERAEIARAVDPLRGKDYLELLRVKPDTKPDQIERSRAYLSRHLAPGEGPGPEAIRAFLGEAFEVLTDPVRGPEYRKLAKNATTQKTLRKRQAFEAGPKLARVASALATGQLAHASYLYDWAKALDPELPELEGHRLFLDFCTRPGSHKPEFAHSIRGAMEQVVERCPSNLSLRFYLVILYVAMGERERASSCFEGVRAAESHVLHPLAQVAVFALG